jgi:hypothetical protein
MDINKDMSGLIMELDWIERTLELLKKYDKIEAQLIITAISDGLPNAMVLWNDDSPVIPEIKKLLERRKLAIEKELEKL